MRVFLLRLVIRAVHQRTKRNDCAEVGANQNHEGKQNLLFGRNIAGHHQHRSAEINDRQRRVDAKRDVVDSTEFQIDRLPLDAAHEDLDETDYRDENREGSARRRQSQQPPISFTVPFEPGQQTSPVCEHEPGGGVGIHFLSECFEDVEAVSASLKKTSNDGHDDHGGNLTDEALDRVQH